jgi:hypothetical protein
MRKRHEKKEERCETGDGEKYGDEGADKSNVRKHKGGCKD